MKKVACYLRNFSKIAKTVLMEKIEKIHSVWFFNKALYIEDKKLIFFFKCHTRFQASAIAKEIILSSVIFLGKFFTGVVSHCLYILKDIHFFVNMSFSKCVSVIKFYVPIRSKSVKVWKWNFILSLWPD